MRTLYIFIIGSFCALALNAQPIPTIETTFSILKNEKQQFSFALQKGYTLRALIIQKGIDLEISVYKKDDTVRLAYFDSPNGEFGPEHITFESPADGNYILVIDPLSDDTAKEGKYSIRQKSIKILQAIHDSSFANGSGISTIILSNVNIKNLTNLGMLWGFLKYLHPSIANGDHNWDADLFRVLPNILSAQTKEEANRVLEKWVDALGKPDSCKTCKSIQYDSSIKLLPDYGNLFNNGNLNRSLIEKLDYIKNNRNQDENYYVDLAEGVGNPVFTKENPYYKMVYPDAGYRLLSLFRYWNMIQYFYPYKYAIGENWNNVLPEFIPKFINAKDSIQYTLSCLEIIARIHDSHANIWGINNSLDSYFGKYHAPVQAKFIEDKLVVTDYYSDTLSIKEKIKIGDIITAINNQPVNILVKKYLYLTPGSNYETQLRDMPNQRLLRSNVDSILVEVQRNNKIMRITIPCFLVGKLNFGIDFNPSPKDSSYKILDGNIGYLFPGRYKNSQLPAIKKMFDNTRGIIIDMRCYPSEFMPFTFGAYIKPSESPFVKFTNGDIMNPGLFTFGSPFSNGKLNLAYYKGPIVEIVDASTQSQAEYTTMAFQTAPDMTVIGSTTAGADGNVSPIILPGGIYTLISGIGVYYVNEEETQRKGIKINMELSPTVESIRNGKDLLMEKAIGIINSKNPKP
jgi:hypothetical protein